MWEPAWRRQGREPDYRFTLANERTFLAWVRTTLALLAGGVLLVQFGTRLGPRLLLMCAGVGLAALAALLSVLAYRRWRGNEIAMRLERELPATGLVPLLAGGLALVGTLLAVLIAMS